jgi:outer membrane protein TolC
MLCAFVVGALILVAGCTTGAPEYSYSTREQLKAYQVAATYIDEPAVESGSYLNCYGAAPPLTINTGPPKYLDLTLEEAVRLGLQNSQVVRRLGVSVLDQPARTPTRFDPAIQEMNPGPGVSDLRDIGVEAALAAFDAQLAGSVFAEKNDRALNNVFFGGGTRLLQQDVIVFQKQLSKKAVTGTNFALRQTTTYDANNAPGNAFPSAWDTIIEGEFRHPLLRGGGARFNRINGNAGIAGVPSGVLIARVAGDIKLVDLEMGVRDLVRDVERAYWALYFSYRNLDTAVAARNASLETWRRIHALYLTGRRGGEAEKESQAREQYYRFEEAVQNALAGGGDTPENVVGDRAPRGVQELERQLRYLIGLPINDGCLIRPVDEPPLAKVIFDWDEVLIEALARRQELRRQKWEIQRTELELIAARNFLLPQFDITGKYRWRGFGHDLLDPERAGRPPFDNAYMELTGGDFQEWTLMGEFSMPLGQRHAHAKVRNAELRITREKAVLREQERKLVQDLSDAVARSQQTYAVTQTAFNRRIAARQYLQSVEAAYLSDNAPLDLVLEAQRRLAEAEIRYHAAAVEYARSVSQVHFVKGSLLDYNEVYLAEGPWPGKAYRDAAQRERRRLPPLGLDGLTLLRSPIVSQGPYAQQIVPGGVPAEMPHDAIPSTPDGSSAPGYAPPMAPPEVVPPGTTKPGDGILPAPPAGNAPSNTQRLPPLNP